jgi:hypothetical protein
LLELLLAVGDLELQLVVLVFNDLLLVAFLEILLVNLIVVKDIVDVLVHQVFFGNSEDILQLGEILFVVFQQLLVMVLFLHKMVTFSFCTRVNLLDSLELYG